MEYITATSNMADGIYNVLHTTIKTIYPKYYPKEVVEFFCRHHSKEHILEGIASGNMGVLVDGGVIVGTGCYDNNHITGVYVLPHYQKQGCGSRIMNCLEAEIIKKHNSVILDASLPAVFLYEHRGYKTVGHGSYELENDVKLVYEIMERKLSVNPVIDRTVIVTVDRPLGSCHPKHKDLYYPINYGYIEGVMAPDGEEQDAYIVGVGEAVDKFTGKIIAIVHRRDDVEEKWVVAPENMGFTKEEIWEQIRFQEQYFDSEIVM